MDSSNPHYLYAQSATSLAAAANSLALAAQALSEAAQALSNINLDAKSIPGTAQSVSNEPLALPQQPSCDVAERSQASASSTSRNAGNGARQNNLAGGSEDESSEGEGECAGPSEAWCSSVPSFPSIALTLDWADSTATNQPSSSSRWYIPLQEDFDAIPLIHYLYKKHPKSICFIAHSRNVTPHTAILNKISPNPPIVRAPHKQASASRAIEKLKTSTPTLLLFRGNHTTTGNLPGIQLDSIIHWGLPPGDSFISQIRSARASNTYLLLPLDEQSPTTIRALMTKNILKHPESVMLSKSDRSSPLDLLREQTREGLSSIQSSVLTEAYDDHLGTRCKERYPAIEAAQLANQFSARVLLRGRSADGNQSYAPIGPALPVKANMVSKCRLEPAVKKGLLQVTSVDPSSLRSYNMAGESRTT